MFIQRKAIPRRSILRGIGTAVALPFLTPWPRPSPPARRKLPCAWRSSMCPTASICATGIPKPKVRWPPNCRAFSSPWNRSRTTCSCWEPDPQYRPRAARWRGRPWPLLRVLPYRHPGEEVSRPTSKPASRSTSWWPTSSAARRAFPRSKSAWKTRARRAIAIPAIPARTPIIWLGAARRSLCPPCSIRARCSSGCSAMAWR